ncbi:conserved hypothetical protein [Theileria equi strain WA]|uniref:Uncharacterized protein n=1 Tax=Theileria equi strain WA TaxID=1537102 RepID=L1LE81_THEEQ|nr:conserved hypothetical protein [Theileria equi strain WA]EKX73589.1 conserved hypothetical protein [Theileria equi strain WA]|eukprot:XP_004833041.1 conserved hypothetical protein [Theileria equi strain WA]
MANEAVLSEIADIDTQLKNWFLFRRIQAERSLSIKKLLDANNFIGLAGNNSNVPVTDRVLWHDIVNGRPELEDELSLNAREMKADKYMDIFKQSCDIDNECRLPGSLYFQCLQNHFKASISERFPKCQADFDKFNQCRNKLKEQQEMFIQEAIKRQDEQDSLAKKLFERRVELVKKL